MRTAKTYDVALGASFKCDRVEVADGTSHLTPAASRAASQRENGAARPTRDGRRAAVRGHALAAPPRQQYNTYRSPGPFEPTMDRNAVKPTAAKRLVEQTVPGLPPTFRRARLSKRE
jgi:hypothetical protein